MPFGLVCIYAGKLFIAAIFIYLALNIQLFFLHFRCLILRISFSVADIIPISTVEIHTVCSVTNLLM